jgi:branched-chain amino acid transport system ATP-binding protein
VLEIDELSVAYGRIRALKGVSLVVRTGEVVCLIGSNGAGKSTLLRTIAGLLVPGSGVIRLDGVSLARQRAHRIARLGLRLVQEGRGLLTRMTVWENLQMGLYARTASGGGVGELEAVLELFPVLRERRTQLAGTLSGGEQQQLAIARAMVARPRLLMLDEPSLGLAPILVKDIFQIIRRLNANGVTILLVEQNARQALQIADRGYVLEAGQIVLEGAAAELLRGEAIQRAYLGGRVTPLPAARQGKDRSGGIEQPDVC